MPYQHDLAAELQKIYDSEIYDSEINVRISWLWDGGLDVWLGDYLNGYEATESVKSAADIVPWLQDVIAHFYPASTYAETLGADVVSARADAYFTHRRPARESPARTGERNMPRRRE